MKKIVNLLWQRTLFGIVCAIFLPAAALAGAYEDFFIAAKNDDATTISALLRRGLDPNLIEEERGSTGLIVALHEGSMNVFNVLVNAPNIDLEATARNGDNALMVAAYKGNTAAVKTLLAKGVSVNRPNWTALHYAAASGNNQIIQMLLNQGAHLNALSPNKTTPIMMAAWEGHIFSVKLLLDSGADASLRNEAGLTALDIAVKSGHKDIAEGLAYRLKKSGK